MAVADIELRVAALEAEMARVATLEAKIEQIRHAQTTAAATAAKPWWEPMVGAFADDPAFEEAMRLGREYRESLRPKAKARRG